ncbi:excalibur calcium-binding domain-containing protein [Mesorhizobium sp. M0618]|uniref:excalibur calcium-binding domain-containing protein n=1 Tax=unclassified Mesorhizobium TaxID=325217 RepID=UPI0033354C98
MGKLQEPCDWRAAYADGAAPSRQPLGIISCKLVAQSGLSCARRRTCGQTSSCDEAQWYLHNCSRGGKLDRDADGMACEPLLRPRWACPNAHGRTSPHQQPGLSLNL